MDELNTLGASFGPDEVPAPAMEQRARAALQNRIAAQPVASVARATPDAASRRRAWRLGIPITVGVAAAAVVAGFALYGGTVAAPAATPSGQAASVPYDRPVNAAQYLEDAAWTAERHQWVDPRPDQFMYIETRSLLNDPAYLQDHPNDPIVPSRGRYRTTQEWTRIDGQVIARMNNGKLEVSHQGDHHGYWVLAPWSQIAALTTPEKVAYYLAHPGSVLAEPEAMITELVLPPAVQAAVFRYLARQPGMKLNPDAVNLDGRPAIGLGRVLEGYLSEQLLFDKQTYALIGEREVAVADHVNRGDDGTSYTHKGDVFRQVIYNKMIIVDQAGQTS
jgi:hypothetical protein